MKPALFGKGLSLVALVVASSSSGAARADNLYEPYGLAPGAGSAIATWGSRTAPPADATSVARDAPATRARDMLSRARFLDDAASVDEKAATELAARIPSLRTAAKAARDRAERGTPEERELLGARAEDLETDVVISEAEITFKRSTAAENRRTAHELRLRAMRLVREPTRTDEPVASACDPPFRYTADGRKVYRVECLK
jgi:hypothetical protein